MASQAAWAGESSRPRKAEVAASRAAIDRYLARNRTLKFYRGLHVHPDLPVLWEHHDLHAGSESLVLASARRDTLHLDWNGLSTEVHDTVSDTEQLRPFGVREWSHLDGIVGKAMLKAARVRGTASNAEARARARNVLLAQSRATRELDRIIEGETPHPGLEALLDLHRARREKGDVTSIALPFANAGSAWLSIREHAGRAVLAVGDGTHLGPIASRSDLARFKIRTPADLDRAVDRAFTSIAPEDLE